MKNKTVIKLCLIAIMSALFIVLNAISINLGTLKITMASLPILILVLYYNSWQEAVVAVLLGELLHQLLYYGLTLTTSFWVLAPAVRPIVFWFIISHIGKSNNYPKILIASIIAAICTSVANTIVIYMDAVIFDYYTFAYVFGSATLRFITSIIAACIIGPLSLVINNRLKKI